MDGWWLRLGFAAVVSGGVKQWWCLVVAVVVAVVEDCGRKAWVGGRGFAGCCLFQWPGRVRVRGRWRSEKGGIATGGDAAESKGFPIQRASRGKGMGRLFPRGRTGNGGT